MSGSLLALPHAGCVLPLDKPVGPTSHDAVAAARRALGLRRIGHTGTLDPFASGLLVLCLGPATRLAEYLTPLPKTYRATMRLGEATDTDDLQGEVIARSDAWREVSEQRLREALATQVGELRQVPPLYSAKKVDGVRAYAAARRGEAVERKPATVVVHRLELLSFEAPEVSFEVECAAGTYIRAIARDVGEALGVGGHLRELRRTASGALHVDRAVPLDALGDTEAVAAALLSPAAAVGHLPHSVLADDEVAAVRLGRGVATAAPGDEGETCALLDGDGALVAIAERRGETLQPRKVFA
jgi:tRNA pseudouridine55 synthase